MSKYEEVAARIAREECWSLGELLVNKAQGYGPSWLAAEKCLEALYPDGIPVKAYRNALLTVRVLDKLCRLAQAGGGEDAGGESPWRDVAGYGIVGLIASKAVESNGSWSVEEDVDIQEESERAEPITV